MKAEREQLTPEARSEGLVMQQLDGELLVYDEERHRAHCLNETAVAVWRLCDGKTTAASMARLLEKETGSMVGEDVVWLALEQLSKNCLLVRHISPRDKSPAVTRREAVKRIAVAAAIALPVVTSIVAPKAIQAVTCKPPGAPCADSAECCSGLCNGSAHCA